MKTAFETFVSYLLCDWVTSVGTVITTTSAVVFLTFAFQDFTNPYFGIVVFLILPALFVLGLLLIPLGVWRCARRQGGMRNIPRVELAGTRTLQFVALIAILTIVNVAIISAATFNGVQYMDSNEFCGTVCHKVMTPPCPNHVSAAGGKETARGNAARRQSDLSEECLSGNDDFLGRLSE